MNFPIYKYEIEAGLLEEIQSNATIAYVSKLNPIKPTQQTIDRVAAFLKTNATEEQWDLAYIDSVLASVGWNGNDDVFDAGETWVARSSPVDKQFNFMHDETDIIGHMTASYVLGPEGELISDDVESIPSSYDVVVSSVLYKTWSDEKLQQRMDGIIEGIAKGEWFVSMECLFRNFDYAVISPDGEHSIVPRTEASSFLTKHLRIYGGQGEFEGNKIGRLLRNFTFSGKGLVYRPANPRSIIFNDTNPFNSSATVQTVGPQNRLIESSAMENEDMSENNDRVEKLEAEIRDLRQEKEDLVKVTQAESQRAFEAETTELKSQLEAAKEGLAEATKTIASQEETITSLEADVKSKDEAIAAGEKDKKELMKEKTKSDRLAKLAEAGVDSTKAEEIVTKWETASDEQFEDVVALHVEAVKAAEETPVEEASADEDTNESSADADLDDAKADEEPNLSADASDENDDLVAATASFIGGLFNSDSKE